MRDYKNDIIEYINHEIETIKALDVDSINAAINLLEETRLNGGSVYIFGNGGSSTTASHYQNDFNKGISEYAEKKYDFHCLNDNIATVMAIANDISFDEVFRFQLCGRLKEDDIVIAISGSGNSKNVINGVKYAREQGCKVITLTGYDGGKLKSMADVTLHVPINSMQITEDVHMILDHLMMAVLYKNLYSINHIRIESK